MNADSAWLRYDEVPEEYDRFSAPHFFEPVAAHLASLLPLQAGHRLLDLACGTGVVAAAALRRLQSLRAVGFDLSLPMMRRARTRKIRHLVVGNISDLPFANSSFEHLTASFLINHLHDPPSAIANMIRLVGRNGTISLTSWAVAPNESPFGSAWNEIAERYVPKEELAQATRRALPSEERFREASALLALLQNAGLRALCSERKVFVVGMKTMEFIASRNCSVSARFMRAALEDERWQQFQGDINSAFVRRFGDAVRFETAVNFAVACVSEAARRAFPTGSPARTPH